ncbi:MAG TPA: excinuclease ABC subunit UvrA [Candidatus Polarisedimenticolia bacterium]|nr:excinuclease ABC subunit UvrA [Candidatus Polarisedimenticolia bacterium]
MDRHRIVIKGAAEHNLKHIDLEIPKDSLVVITGVSGSGKSSLAFDTIYAEGQRRYVESLSAYARQFLDQMEKPDVEHIEGLSPAISIEQRSASHNPRSTVATVTEIYDYLRVLFARAGTPHCPKCGRVIASQTVQQMADRLLALEPGAKFSILAPIVRGRKGEYKKLLAEMMQRGFIRARIDGAVVELGDEIDLDKKKAHTIEIVVDRLVAGPGIRQRLADSLETALGLAEGLAAVQIAGGADGGQEILFSERLACLRCGVSLPEMSPRAFSFNSPFGACQGCGGLGSRLELDPEKIVADQTRPIGEGLCGVAGWGPAHASMYLKPLMREHKFTLSTPFHKLPKEVRRILLHGSGDKEYQFEWIGGKSKFTFRRKFEGIIPSLMRRYRTSRSESLRPEIEKLMTPHDCADCGGARLRAESRGVRVAGRPIHEYSAMPVEQALEVFGSLSLPPAETAIARPVLKEIIERLGFLNDVGLGYLTLDRSASTLSGGEGQRIRLATQIGSRLSGVLYVLDEPSIGLHQRDNQRLLAILSRMRDLGNTVIVVEHDEETMRAADHLIDLGPGAGEHGGEVVAEGRIPDLLKERRSLTGAYLSGRLTIEIPKTRRRGSGRSLVVKGAAANNLKSIDVKFPLGVFTAVTGVSGSGKSTLVNEILYRVLARRIYGSADEPGRHKTVEGAQWIDKVIDIDQSPIGRTPRSNPATYTDVFGPIRDLFAEVPESRARGYSAGRYSFNVKGGRCEACEGDGIKRIEMHFLPDVHVTCEECQGKRYNRETLEIRYKGRTIAEVLEMSVETALAFFANIPVLKRRLETLASVGLDYVRLGQPATTLSGGEAQRIKLSRELSKVGTGSTLYVLDEPTTGLHFDDIRKLVGVLVRLVEAGNTVVVIEHNLDVIKTADHLIDLGPEGGAAGGRIIAEGTPEQVARVSASHTGKFLAQILGARAASPRPARRDAAGDGAAS